MLKNGRKQVSKGRVLLALAVCGLAACSVGFWATPASSGQLAAKGKGHWGEDLTSEKLKKADSKELFREWKAMNSKEYGSEDAAAHGFGNFKKSLAKIAAGNDEFAAGKRKYRMAINKFADLSKEEYIAKFMNSKLDAEAVDETPTRKLPQPVRGLKEDATSLNFAPYVRPVKDQGECGSCYALAAAAVMECTYAIHFPSNARDLSPQQLMDCSPYNAADSCDGGSGHMAIAWASVNGVCKLEDYPYMEADGVCKTTCTGQVSPNGVYSLPTRSDANTAGALNYGCVLVGVWASSEGFRYYSDGILDGDCGFGEQGAADHQMTLTGYGVEDGNEYWILKNSFGDDWGEAGYIRMCKNCGKGSNGMCAINTRVYITDF